MKKVLLSAVAVLAFTFGNAQSNQKGTMHVNVIGGFLSGSGTQQDDEAGSTETKFSATGAQFGANFQYGLAESFSAGIGLEVGTSILTPKDYNFEDYGYTKDFTLSTFKVNLSGRYYFVNKDNFNVYAGPSVGFTSGKDKTAYGFDYGTAEKTKFSGLNYGVNAGGNYYFTDVVGVIVNLGYEGNSLKSKQTEDGTEHTGKTNIGGIKVMAGLALKF
ncbi:outer membrane beta-barrel protein [Flavobacterium sp. F372]|uniref:Outer membrane beta-barrel protein n=1 Tax=Flavobacterium bernardetii TaxID=2813823 RepID=A0ABR7J1X2_9FLAO|nr:outer membrane beta-barrel protein [Flavobacterium bernardetii]MBC5836064.1 outer membrane beta-barrel protein [Flavobacterium bernardetii]NHF71196.1 outer membrane beta-barrel protein [Flavobacterium bernardetii]